MNNEELIWRVSQITQTSIEDVRSAIESPNMYALAKSLVELEDTRKQWHHEMAERIRKIKYGS